MFEKGTPLYTDAPAEFNLVQLVTLDEPALRALLEAQSTTISDIAMVIGQVNEATAAQCIVSTGALLHHPIGDNARYQANPHLHLDSKKMRSIGALASAVADERFGPLPPEDQAA